MSSLLNPAFALYAFEDFTRHHGGHSELQNQNARIPGNWWMVTSAWGLAHFRTAYLARRAAMIWVRGGHQATVWPPHDAAPLTIQPGTQRARRLFRMEHAEVQKRTERARRRQV